MPYKVRTVNPDLLESVRKKIPTLIVSQKVIQAIVDESLAHPRTETGQALVGLEIAGYMIVLATIPDIEDTHRSAALFRQGGDDQVVVYEWLRDHWEDFRKNASGTVSWQLGETIRRGDVPTPLQTPLAYLGDWHKHPDGMTYLSGTDTNQIADILKDPPQQRSQILAPLITINLRQELAIQVGGEFTQIDVSARGIRIDWYYAHEDLPGQIWRLTPVIVPDSQLPWLPPLSWHISNPHRFETEVDLLRRAGYKVGWITKEMNGDPLIREVVFGVDHPDWHSRLLMITPWNYPTGQPEVQLIPKSIAMASELADDDDDQEGRFRPLVNWLEAARDRASGFWVDLAGMFRKRPYRPLWVPDQYLVHTIKNMEKELLPDETETTEPGPASAVEAKSARVEPRKNEAGDDDD